MRHVTFVAARNGRYAPSLGVSFELAKLFGNVRFMSVRELAEDESLVIFSQRQNSSSRRERLLVFGSLAVFTLLVAVGFGLSGAWPVVPFAGLECVALFLAYRWLQRHDGDCESVLVDGDDLVVVSQSGGKLEYGRVSRFWAQVVVESLPDGKKCTFLRSHGNSVEFGKLLCDQSKMLAAKRLREKISGFKLNQ